MDKPTCETCPYWGSANDDNRRSNTCHRFPPRIVEIQALHTGLENMKHASANTKNPGERWDAVNDALGMSYVSYSPTTDRDDFCGEHPDFPKWIESTRATSKSAHESKQLTPEALRRMRRTSLADWMDCNGIPKAASARALMGCIAGLYEEGLTLEQMLQHRRLRQKKAHIHSASEFLEKWANRTQDVDGYSRKANG